MMVDCLSDRIRRRRAMCGHQDGSRAVTACCETVLPDCGEPLAQRSRGARFSSAVVSRARQEETIVKRASRTKEIVPRCQTEPLTRSTVHLQ